LLVDEVNFVIQELKEKGIDKIKFLRKFRCPSCGELKHKTVMVCYDCGFVKIKSKASTE
jgi:ribosomal protein S27AE